MPILAQPVDAQKFHDPFAEAFEGGISQGIAYQDASVVNLGNFRTEEYVHALSRRSRCGLPQVPGEVAQTALIV